MASKQPKRSMAEEALLERPLLLQQAPEERDGHGVPLQTLLGFMFPTFNTAMAMSSWNTRLGAVSFVGFCYMDLVMLFYCLRHYRWTPPGSPRRELLRMAVWLLTTALTLAVFQLLELWFLAMHKGQTENSLLDLRMNHAAACPDLNGSYPPSVP